MCVFY
jgi:hypothetical protein